MNINKKYQGGGINKKRMGDHSQTLVNPEPLIPEVGNKGDTPLVKRYQDGGEVQSGAGQKKDELKEQIMSLQMRLQQIEDQMQSLSGRQGMGGSMYQNLVDQRREIIDQIKVLNASRRDAGGSLFMEHGGKMKYGHGGKTTMAFLQDGGKPEFDPGVDRQTTEEAGNPTKNLTTKNPSGGKWLGDKRPPMYGASEEHIPFLTTVYEMMDAGENMDQMYHSQEYLRPYIKYIIAGQNETVLPSLENAEAVTTMQGKGKGKSKMPAFMENMSKDEIIEVLKNMPGKK
jgi:hypothetical protein